MKVSFVSQDDFENLIQEAFASVRLRSHLLLHESPNDAVQRIMIGLVKGTYIPPHFHEFQHQWEHFHVFQGEVELMLFDSNGCLNKKVILGGQSKNIIAQISPLTPHTLVCRSPTAVIMEIKEGPFDEKCAKVIPSWSYSEDYSILSRDRIIAMMGQLSIGDRFSL
ncbi:WbuC family cupin fold metalloprotein [Escherichia coli]|uniref:WbuC n=2 Tax=Escherichia coli TaxID=562 RepID=A3E2D3_ECOLX|nr:WbuC family cupin fold metalloprotein [Escherichia coli]EFW7027398.1 WbuC family cupin fold metalloprotein [Shigella sonnei]EIG5924007.1 WbuC family cupin fold metalloprotein [Escherichia coli O45:H2]ABG81796.1 WbuC [Escherichia coli]ABG81812.1 WbuC [Escherichia coli]AJR19436.1 WbuC [Escherichia coli]